MKKLLTALSVTILSLSILGCSSTASARITEDEFSQLTVLSDSDFNKMYSDIENYKGKRVSFSARVFSEPLISEKGVTMQVFADPVNSEKNTFVTTNNPDFEVKNGDYLKVDGLVYDMVEYKNKMDATMSAPQILAYNLEVVDVKEALYPTLKTIEVNQTQNQHGYELTIEKVEFAELETRVYVSITNNTDDEITFYTFNARLTQNGTQYDEETNYHTDYPEPNSEILPTIKTSGIITFPPIKEEPFQIILEGNSHNWNLDIKPFIFDIKN